MEKSVAESPQAKARTPVILIVEDEVIVRMTAAEALRDAGLEVLEAANADEAIALLESPVRLDLVFSDVNLPGSLDGLALARLLRSRRPGLKLVVASGHLAAPPPPELADAFLPKPYRLSELVQRISGLLDTDAA